MADEFLAKKVEEIKKEAEEKFTDAKSRIPEKYQGFIMLLSQKKTVGNLPQNPDDMPQDCYQYDGKTCITVKEPYMTVSGRNLWFVDSHEREDGTRAKFNITDNLDKIIEIIAEKGECNPKIPVIVTVDSEFYGKARGEATVFWKGSGADETNPIENASTSALGRALSKLGFGIIGNGIASAEEVIEAKQYQEQKSKQDSQSNEDSSKTGKNDNNSKNDTQKETTLKIKLTDDPPAEPNEKYWALDAITPVGEGTLPGKVYIPVNLKPSFVKELKKGSEFLVKGYATRSDKSFSITVTQISAQNAA
ncbi:MAG: hypothetical protein K9L17_13375 [Clostridiales bacterium]|nr:hypothetical protein [Clostridiales bacterium]MCF8023666.1 hypothetical protein [Clostridiales bacterium]